MLDANVKETITTTELLHVSSRFYGKTGEKRLKEAAGKPPILLTQKRAENLQ